MPATKNGSLIKLGTAAGLFLLAGVFRQLDWHLPALPSALCFLATNLIYIALVWGISIRRRILHRDMRRYLLLSCAMAVFWLLLRPVKYRYFQSDGVSRMLWYCYYIPQIFAPLFGFLSALTLGRREDEPMPPHLRLMYIPACLLVFGILINDRHQLAFRFLTGRMSDGAPYAHDVLYYAAMGWAIALMLASVGVIFHKCRILESCSRAWIPLCVFLAGALLSTASFANVYTFHKVPEYCCLTFIEHAWLRGELTLPEGLLSIGDSAFTNCASLNELYLPSTLTSIGAKAFFQNWSLSYVVMSSALPPVVAADAFAECSALEDLDLNEHCTKQQMLDMQALVDSMGLACTVWRSENSLVEHFNDDLDTYADGFLTSYTGTQARVRPWSSCDSVQTIGIADGVFKGSQTLEIFAVPHSDNFTTIGAEAFMDSSLRVVDLFDSVTTIGARAFANCTQLEELTIPESVTSIGEGAFDGLTGLKKLTILCDPALIPEGSFLVNGAPINAEIRLSANATDEQLALISERLQRP